MTFRIRKPRHSIWDLLLTTSREWWRDNVFQLAASIAFYTIFSLAPIILISVGVATIFFSRQQAQEQIISEIESLTGVEGGKVARQVIGNMGDMVGDSPEAILFGLLVMIIGSTAVFTNLQSALNRIWHVEAKASRGTVKNLVKDRMRSFGIVLSVGFLLLVSMVFSAVLNGIQQMMGGRVEDISWLWGFFNVTITFCVITLLFAMIYKYLPDVRLRWGDVIIGAAITAVLFSIGKYFIGIYLGHVAIGSTYGAAGSFVVLLSWIYYSALICFFGAEFTHVYARRIGMRFEPEPHARSIPQSLRRNPREQGTEKRDTNDSPTLIFSVSQYGDNEPETKDNGQQIADDPERGVSEEVGPDSGGDYH